MPCLYLLPNKINSISIQCHCTFRSRGGFGANAINTFFQFFYQQIHHRDEYQRKEGAEQQSKDHGPGQRAPERNVVSAKIKMGIELRKERDEVDVKSYC